MSQREELHKALLSAFPTRAALARLTDFRLDTNLDEIAAEANLADAVYRLIQWAGAQGRTAELVRGALAENPGNAQLQSVAQGLGLAANPAPTPAPAADAERHERLYSMLSSLDALYWQAVLTDCVIADPTTLGQSRLLQIRALIRDWAADGLLKALEDTAQVQAAQQAEAARQREAEAARQQEAEVARQREAEAARQQEEEVTRQREAEAARQREHAKLEIATQAPVVQRVTATVHDKQIVTPTKRSIWSRLQATAYFCLGVFHATPKQHVAALADFTRAIELCPEWAMPYNERGCIYADQQRYDEVLADFTRALELNPQFGRAYHNRGVLYRDQQRYTDALADYDRAIELSPKNAYYYNNRSHTYRRTGRAKEADADARRAHELDPDNY